MGDKASSLDICELRRMVDPERVEAVRALMPHDRYVDPRCRQTTGRRPPQHPPRAFQGSAPSTRLKPHSAPS